MTLAGYYQSSIGYRSCLIHKTIRILEGFSKTLHTYLQTSFPCPTSSTSLPRTPSPKTPTFDDDDAVGLGLSERVGGDTAVLSAVLRLAAADLHRDHPVGVGDVVLGARELLVTLVPLHLWREAGVVSS